MGGKYMKKIAILMSTYNGEKYLRQQLNSLFAQDQEGISVWVRDDGSTDSTHDILEEFSSKGKLHWYTGENIRSAKSFMDLVNHVDGYDYYAFCDQDDVWKPEKIKRAITLISKEEKQHPNLPVFYNSDYQLVDADMNPLPESHHKSNTTYNAAILSSCATGCTVVFNKSLRKYLVAYTPAYQAMHDSWACRVCLAVGGIVLFDEDYKSLFYRQHGANVLGDHRSLKMRVKLIYNRIISQECSASRQAQELLVGYADSMSDENLEITKMVANYKTSFSARMKLLFSRKVTTPYAQFNRGIKVAIMFGYF